MEAQRYNLNANQTFRWRRLFREPECADGAARFAPVVVKAAPGQEPDAATMSTLTPLRACGLPSLTGCRLGCCQNEFDVDRRSWSERKEERVR